MLQESFPLPTRSSGPDPAFVDAVVAGLSLPSKALPCHYFYDDRGSDLFERITELPEYYLTRSEAELLRGNAVEIMRDVSPESVFLEFGSGSSRKMDVLLKHAPDGSSFVPIDVSPHALAGAYARLSSKFPGLAVRPIVDDFSALSVLPLELARKPKRAFFLGSTIGNFEPVAASRLLRRWKRVLGPASQLIIGADVLKDRKTLLAAYNDVAGVTAQFNLNILARINREIGPAFDLSTFEHSAIFNVDLSRIEMHLVSRVAQVVRFCGRAFRFEAGESIHTENSYKHAPSAFRRIIKAAGWVEEHMWMDGQFGLYRLR